MRPSRAWSRSRLLILVTALALLLAGTLASPSPGVAEEPSIEDQMAWQASVLDYIDELTVIAEAHANFSGTVIDTIGHTFTVQGTGSAPSDVQAKFASAPSNLTVSWQSVLYTERMLDDEGEALFTSDESVSVVAFNDDMSGLVAQQVPDADGYTPTHDELETEAGTDVPVTWTSSADYPDTTDGRGSGGGPFHGGSRIKHPIDSNTSRRCSTAVKVTMPNGNNAMLTAGHCSRWNPGVNWKLYNDDTGIGDSTSWASETWDIQGISGKTYSTGGVWVGGAVEYQTLNYVTEGSGRIHDKELLSVSAGFSGSQAVRVLNPNVRVKACLNGTCYRFDHFVRVQGTNNQPAWGEADSGSAAVILKGDSKLQIAGIASIAGGTVLPCNGMDWSGKRICFQIGYLSPWYRFKKSTGLSLP